MASDCVVARLAAALVLVMGLLAQSAQAATSLTRTSSFAYDSTSGLLTKEVIEPDTSNLCLVTTYSYDAFGNKTAATTRNCNGSTGEAAAPTGDAVIASRSSSTTFDSQGRFATGSTNALNQSETRVFNANFGGVTSLTGPNSLTTTWSYDSLGRKSLETRADGTKTEWTYAFCNGVNGGTASCPTYGKYLATTTPKDAAGSANGAITKVYYDALNREIRTETEGFSGTAIYKDTQYDSNGRVSQVSKPYYSGGTVYWTVYAYDVLGRVTTETQPSTTPGTIRAATTYNGLTVTVTVSNNGGTTNLPEAVTQTRTTTRNSQGQTVTVADTQSNTITYTYDPFGNLLTTNAGGVTTTLAYDLRGRKTAMADPNMGSWSYVYDVAGQLKSQTDAKSQVTTMTYDLLGRMTSRTEPDVVNNWYYDAYKSGAACTKGIGKLCEVDSPAGGGGNGYNRAYTYDSLGRVSQIATTIDASYTISYGYDTNGRLLSTTYPATTVDPSGFVTKNVYNARGYLWKVTDNAGTLVYWQANTLSATGKVLTETLGNGLSTTRGYDELDRMTSNVVGSGTNVQNFTYAYDTIGNLTQRVDVIQSSLTENFAYDRLNRLLQSSGTGLTTHSQSFNATGNITYKSDVGTYNYNAQGTPCTTETGGGGPHALCSVTGTVNGYANPAFSYDANGSLTAGLGRTLTYTSFNMPATVVAANNLVPGTSVTYTYVYNADHERVKHIIDRTDGTFTTIYLHPAGKGELLYEKEIKPTLTEHKHYIVAGSILVGVYLSRSDSTTETRYFHSDRLGSLTLITNASGAVIERLAYEAYGKRRYPAGTDDTANGLYGITTDRGFTGHEHLDEIALIHMNGRIYDPLIARFMTADPSVQLPTNLQDYNRYSYVGNNPLRYYDPTGYGWFSDFFSDPVGTIFHTVEQVFSNPTAVINIAFTFAGMPEVGALVSSAVGTVQNGGNIGDFLKSLGTNYIGGMFAGPASGYIGSTLGLDPAGLAQAFLRGGLGGGIGGGLTEVVNGGSFAEGFKSGATSGLVTSGIVWGYYDYKTTQFINETCGGGTCTERTIQALREIGQSPVGQRVFDTIRSSASGPINIVENPDVEAGRVDPRKSPNKVGINPNWREFILTNEWGKPEFAWRGGLTMDLATLVIHEMAHTAAGGALPEIPAVGIIENPYRLWTGKPSATGYYKPGDVQSPWSTWPYRF
jgi:RHS repeat-associated protein